MVWYRIQDATSSASRAATMLWLMRLMSVCICICVRVVWQAIGVIVVFYLGPSISLACDKHQPTGIYYLRDTLRIPCLCLLPLSPQATYMSYSPSLSLSLSLSTHTYSSYYKYVYTYTYICIYVYPYIYIYIRALQV